MTDTELQDFKQWVKARFEELLNEQNPSKFPKHGICELADDYDQDDPGVWVQCLAKYLRWVKHYARAWEYYSGNEAHPIPSTMLNRGSAHCYYMKQSCGALWVGRQLNLRRMLLHHLLNHLEYLK